MSNHTLQKIWKVLKASFNAFSKYKISKKGASLAYYTIFSLPGILMVIITILDTLYGQEAIDGAFQDKISAAVGEQIARQLQDMISNAAVSGQTTLATIIGILVLIYGATKMFAEMQDSINQIWELKPKAKKGWMKTVITRLTSFGLVLILGLLLLASFVLSGVISFLGDYFSQYLPHATVILVSVINWAISFLVVVLLFAIIFRVLPDAKIRWRDVTISAIVTTLLFMVGKYLIGIYMAHSQVGSTYGAAGSMIILLLWIFYSSMILYFGVAFTKEYAAVFGKDIYPYRAVWNKTVEIDYSKPLREIEQASKEGRIQPKEEN